MVTDKLHPELCRYTLSRHVIYIVCDNVFIVPLYARVHAHFCRNFRTANIFVYVQVETVCQLFVLKFGLFMIGIEAKQNNIRSRR